MTAIMDLRLRKTHRYVGTYANEDDWEDLGVYEIIGNEDITKESIPEDEQDMCDPTVRRLYVIVNANEGTSDDQIKQALRDCNSRQGCACEHDCCGCRSYYADDIKRRTGDLWQLTVGSSRNF